MEKCECNGKEDEYFDIVDWNCVQKNPTGIYEVSVQHGTQACYDVCQMNPSDPRCPKETITDTRLLNLFRVFEFLSANINLANPFTKALVTRANRQSIYDDTLSKLDFELVCSVGKAKILPGGVLNGELANIMNIYGLVLWINTLGTEFASTETIEAMADLGCSAGQLNLFFQGIERKYNFNKINTEELSSLISFEEFIFEIRQSVIRAYEMFNANVENFLQINWNEGDIIGGDGAGSYNSKYKWFYIVKFLINNKNLREIPDLSIEISEQVKAKYNELNEKATQMSEFYVKYIKYKNKYLKLKKTFNKVN